MKNFHFEIKWPPIKSSIAVIEILMLFTCISISINGQCNDYLLKPGENSTFFPKSQSCLRLICEQDSVSWKKNQDRIVIGMY